MLQSRKGSGVRDQGPVPHPTPPCMSFSQHLQMGSRKDANSAKVHMGSFVDPWQLLFKLNITLQILLSLVWSVKTKSEAGMARPMI